MKFWYAECAPGEIYEQAKRLLALAPLIGEADDMTDGSPASSCLVQDQVPAIERPADAIERVETAHGFP